MKTTSKRIKVVVDRKQWGSGALYNIKTKKCCVLGFLAIKCGLSKRLIGDVSTPSFAEKDHRCQGSSDIAKWPKKLLLKNGEDSKLCLDIIRANDNEILTLAEREKKLIGLFEKMNVELSFRGKMK